MSVLARKILLSGASFITLFILYLNYQTYFSIEASRGKRNIENIKKVKAGMNIKSVLKIMGQPDLIDYCDLEHISKGYNYKTNDESYVHVTICFDTLMNVKKVYYPKHN